MVLLEFENWGLTDLAILQWLNENGFSCNCCVYRSIGFGILEMLILNLWIFLLILISLPKSIHFLFLSFFHWNRTISWIIISQFEVCHNGSVWLVYDILCMIVKLIFWERIKKRGFQVGLSTETRYPTHPKKPSDPARKPSDPTPMTVGGGSPPPEPVTGGLVGGFSLPKSEKPEPTGENP